MASTSDYDDGIDDAELMRIALPENVPENTDTLGATSAVSGCYCMRARVVSTHTNCTPHTRTPVRRCRAASRNNAHWVNDTTGDGITRKSTQSDRAHSDA